MTTPLSDDTFGPPAAGPVPTGKTAARWEDFIDIFTSPRAVFERRRDTGFGIPLLIQGVLGAIIGVVAVRALMPIFDAEFTRQMAIQLKANPSMTPAQMATGRSIAEKFMVVGPVVAPFIMPLVLGVIIWIAGALTRAKMTMSNACLVAVFALVPRLVEGLLKAVQGFVLDPASLRSQFSVSFSPARFLDPDTTSQGIMALVGRVDLFVLWSSIIIAIGVAVMARTTVKKGAIAAFVVWIIASLPSLLTLARGQ